MSHDGAALERGKGSGEIFYEGIRIRRAAFREKTAAIMWGNLKSQKTESQALAVQFAAGACFDGLNFIKRIAKWLRRFL